MKKCVSLYLSNDVDVTQRIKDIKEVGYDGVILGVYDKNESLSLEEEYKKLKEAGLEISMIHASYFEPKLNDFWKDNENGDWVEADLLSQIERVKDMGVKDFVIHSCGSKECVNSEIGLERLRRLLAACEKNGMNLTIENLFLEEQVDYIFDNIKSDSLTFCFDSGHKNFLTQGAKYIDRYKDKTTCLHLHNNFGIHDDHNLITEGTIDLDDLARELSLIPETVALSSEVKCKKGEYSKEFLKKDLQSLIDLEKQIMAKKK